MSENLDLATMRNFSLEQLWWNVAFIQLGAGVVGFWSISNTVHVGLVSVTKKTLLLLMGAIVLASLLPWILWNLFQYLNADQTWILRINAIYDMGLLFGLMRFTGGPTESWFTPFLLAVTPLAVQLESDKRFALLYFALSLFTLPPN